MPDLRLVGKRPRLVLVHSNDENNSPAIIGYALVAFLDFIVGLVIGWLIWGLS